MLDVNIENNREVMRVVKLIKCIIIEIRYILNMEMVDKRWRKIINSNKVEIEWVI
jgi:hypothetical protein